MPLPLEVVEGRPALEDGPAAAEGRPEEGPAPEDRLAPEKGAAEDGADGLDAFAGALLSGAKDLFCG